MCLRDLISEAVAEVQTGRMNAFTPLRIAVGDTPCHSRRDADNLKLEPIDKLCHFLAETSPFGHDERFSYRHGRNQETVVRRESIRTRGSFRLTLQNRHERGSIDRDQFGNPSSS